MSDHFGIPCTIHGVKPDWPAKQIFITSILLMGCLIERRRQSPKVISNGAAKVICRWLLHFALVKLLFAYWRNTDRLKLSRLQFLLAWITCHLNAAWFTQVARLLRATLCFLLQTAIWLSVYRI